MFSNLKRVSSDVRQDCMIYSSNVSSPWHWKACLLSLWTDPTKSYDWFHPEDDMEDIIPKTQKYSIRSRLFWLFIWSKYTIIVMITTWLLFCLTLLMCSTLTLTIFFTEQRNSFGFPRRTLIECDGTIIWTRDVKLYVFRLSMSDRSLTQRSWVYDANGDIRHTFRFTSSSGRITRI